MSPVPLVVADLSFPSLLFRSREQLVKVLHHQLLLLLIEFNIFSHLFLAVSPLQSRAEPKVSQY